jgi:hypothetical protein
MEETRIVVPEDYRKKILKQCHLHHQGMAKTGEMARASYFWIGMKNKIMQMCQNCDLCTTFAKKLPDEEK